MIEALLHFLGLAPWNVPQVVLIPVPVQAPKAVSSADHLHPSIRPSAWDRERGCVCSTCGAKELRGHAYSGCINDACPEFSADYR